MDCEGFEQDEQKQAQKFSEPCEDEAEVVANGGEDGVCGIAIEALEVAAAEMAVVLHVTDDGFDGGAPSQLALDGAEHAALLTGDEDAARICRIVAAISLVDIGVLNLAAGSRSAPSIAVPRVWPS